CGDDSVGVERFACHAPEFAGSMPPAASGHLVFFRYHLSGRPRSYGRVTARRGPVITMALHAAMRNATTTALIAASSLPLTGCRLQSQARGPSIAFTIVPEAAEGGSARLAKVAGRVQGARPGQKIVLFAKSGVWWVQPFVVKPFTDVNADGTWSGTTHLGMEY